jgi:hypothetical protein
VESLQEIKKGLIYCTGSASEFIIVDIHSETVLPIGLADKILKLSAGGFITGCPNVSAVYDRYDQVAYHVSKDMSNILGTVEKLCEVESNVIGFIRERNVCFWDVEKNIILDTTYSLPDTAIGEGFLLY